MGTRLRSKGVKAVLFIIGIFMLGFSLMCASNLSSNTDCVLEKSYVDTDIFKGEIEREFNDIFLLNFEYKNYTQKTVDEKINLNEFKNRQQSRDWNVKNSQEQITNNYSYDISQAEREGNKDKLSRLIDERNKKLEEVKKENYISDEQIKKELVDASDQYYKSVKERVEAIKDVKYYIKNRQKGEVYTNLSQDVKIEE